MTVSLDADDYVTCFGPLDWIQSLLQTDSCNRSQTTVECGQKTPDFFFTYFSFLYCKDEQKYIFCVYVWQKKIFCTLH